MLDGLMARKETKPPAQPTFRVNFAVRAVVAVEVEAETFEAALQLAREKGDVWALEGLQSEVQDAKVTVIGVDADGGWDFVWN